MENSTPWAVSLDILKTKIRGAGITSWRSLKYTTNECIDAARYYVRTTREIDQALDRARQMCEQFANEIAERGPFYSQNDRATKQARELALLAVDALETELKDARPSDEAVGLNLGW
jgi:hypothetical protein